MRNRLLLSAAVLSLLATAPASAATLVGSYLFNNTLNSSVAGAPALVATDPTGTSGFVQDTVQGNARTVYFVDGDNGNANQGGLTFNSTGLLTSNSYSVALTIKFLQRDNAWRRILDVTERTSDSGFYVDPSNNLDVFPVSGSNANYTNGVFRNIVLTVGNGALDNVSGYIDGGASFTTTTNLLNIGPNGLINLFLDNTQAGGQGEWSQAEIAAVNFYDGVLTPQEVAVINDDPVAPPPSAVPEPATWAMLLSGFGLVGYMARRRAAKPKAITA